MSIHLPPPRDAKHAAAALASLTRLAYPAYEILVADPDGALAADQRLAPFRGRALMLRMDAQTSQAEALNALLAEMDWRARYVAVADPDFAMAPQFLRLAVDHLEREPDLAFVQFPKSLEAAGPIGAAADLEARDALATSRPAQRAILRPGAITVVSVQALQAVGGWRAALYPAAAELGQRLFEANLTGAFIEAPVAAPLRPPGFAELRRTRIRLTRGALHGFKPFAKGGAMRRTAQFAAAPSFWLLPAATLASMALAAAIGRPPSFAAIAAERLAAWTILLTGALAAARLGHRLISAQPNSD